ncbi:hypothetical protein ACIRNI_22770 [Streptomyces sp. NPDC093546]
MDVVEDPVPDAGLRPGGQPGPWRLSPDLVTQVLQQLPHLRP